MNRRILLVEDEAGLVVTLTDRLSSEGYAVEEARDGEKAVVRMQSEPFDLIILDVMLPKKNGFDVCRDIRQLGVQTPILMLTARTQVVGRVLGLKLGADDYLAKPFEMMELLARVEALLRRIPASAASPRDTYRFGEILVDFRKAEVLQNNVPVEMSAREFQLLRYFIEH